VACGGLADVLHDEGRRVDDLHGELTEDARRDDEARHRVLEVGERAAELAAAHRRGLHEEDLGDEEVTAGELVYDVAEERDVRRLHRVTAGAEDADDLAILEEDRAL